MGPSFVPIFVMFRRIWLLFAQTVTVGLGLFVVWQAIVAPTAPESPVPATGSDLTVAVQKASPAVVTVLARRTLRPESGIEIGSDWHDSPELNVQPLGSGVVLDEEGFVLTNHHVVDGVTDLLVTASETDHHLEARLVGIDPETDLALLKVAPGALTPIRMADNLDLQVGQTVLAIGNPFGVGQTVTSGIISALGRHGLGLNIYEDFIQTDAAINQGNSGGALVNAEGELIGINSAIFSPDYSEGFVGIGFAIPMLIIQNVLPSLKSGQEVVRGYFGFIPRQLTQELAQDLGLARRQGVMVKRVLADSPAEEAGLRPFDIILSINQEPVESAHRLLQRIARMKPGQIVTLAVLRGNKNLTLPLVVSQRPTDSLEREELAGEESTESEPLPH